MKPSFETSLDSRQEDILTRTSSIEREQVSTSHRVTSGGMFALVAGVLRYAVPVDPPIHVSAPQSVVV